MANDYITRLAKRYLEIEKAEDYTGENDTTIEEVIEDFTKATESNDKILYYIEFLLDRLNVCDD